MGNRLPVGPLVWSLAFVWIASGLVSATGGFSLGIKILASTGITATQAASLIYAGAIWDIVLGCLLLLPKAQRMTLALQALTIAVYTALVSIIDPQQWLHPFGPITKNVPIFVLTVWLLKHPGAERS